MDIFRMIGIAIIMIIPTFVFTGLLYAWFHTTWVLLPILAIIVILYALIVSGKFSRKAQDA